MEELVKLINGKTIKLLLFEELRPIALENGVKDNRVAIGNWIKQQDYSKKNNKDG